MTLKREGKHVLRAIRSIPVDAIAECIAPQEKDGLYCLVSGVLEFIPADGRICIIGWDDPHEFAQIARYVEARPERVHESLESAQAFVRARFTAVADAAPSVPPDSPGGEATEGPRGD